MGRRAAKNYVYNDSHGLSKHYYDKKKEHYSKNSLKFLIFPMGERQEESRSQRGREKRENVHGTHAVKGRMLSVC